jgi:hypothetical protein
LQLRLWKCIFTFTKNKKYALRNNKKTGLAKVNAALKNFKSGILFNAKKHCGKVKWEIDGLSYQKKLRDEWD